MKRITRLLAVSIFFLPLHNAMAAEKDKDATDLRTIIKTMISRHPELALRKLETEIFEQTPEIIKGQLNSAWQAQAGYRQDEPPLNSGFTAEKTTSFTTGGNIYKPFSSGSSISINVNLEQRDLSYPPPPPGFPISFANINPAVQGSVSIRYQLPLLKNAGRPEYHKNLAAALAEAKVSEHQRSITLRSLSLQALNNYYRLLADDNSIRLAEVAVSRSKQLLKYQRSRERFGLVEKADRMQTEALVAARNLQLQQAKAQKQNDLVELHHIMNDDQSRKIASNLVEITEKAKLGVSLQHAKEKRPEFAMFDAFTQAAQARYELAKNNNAMSLDVVAEVGLMGLEDNVGDTLADMANTDESFAGISLVASDLFGRHSAKRSEQQAKLLVEKTKLEKQINEKYIRDALAATITAINTGIRSLKLAREQVAAENRKYQAELKRYRGGRSDTATIIQFEGDLSSAELVAESQNIILNMLAKQLLWHEGRLLGELGIIQQ